MNWLSRIQLLNKAHIMSQINVSAPTVRKTPRKKDDASASPPKVLEPTGEEEKASSDFTILTGEGVNAVQRYHTIPRDTQLLPSYMITSVKDIVDESFTPI